MSTKNKIEIKHWITGKVLFEFEKENNTLVDTIKEADLYEAKLYEADLHEADLHGADLRGANLRGAGNIRIAPRVMAQRSESTMGQVSRITK